MQLIHPISEIQRLIGRHDFTDLDLGIDNSSLILSSHILK